MGTSGPAILLAIALAPKSFLKGYADASLASFLAILSTIMQAQFQHDLEFTQSVVVVASGCVLQEAATTSKYKACFVKHYLHCFLQIAKSKKTIHQ